MSDESQLSTSDIEPEEHPQSDEPTVLDLYKSIFKDWKSFFNFLVSAFDAARREQINRSLAEKQDVIVEPVSEPEPSPQPETGIRFPWRALLGLGFALLAQRVLEPPGRIIEYGIALYVVAITLVLWSYFADGWRLSPIPPDHDRTDPAPCQLAMVTQ